MSLLKRTKNQPPLPTISGACKYAISFWSGHRLKSICFVHAFEFSLQFPSITQPHWFLSIFPAGWLETVFLGMFFSLSFHSTNDGTWKGKHPHTRAGHKLSSLWPRRLFLGLKLKKIERKFSLRFRSQVDVCVWVCCSVFPSARFSILFHFPVGLCHLESNRVPFYFLLFFCCSGHGKESNLAA